MSSYYGVVFPEFWTGPTGRHLRECGGKDAQLLGLYLISNRHTNMLGLYRLRVDDIRHESGLGIKAVERGFAATAAVNFARYDAATSYVWVLQMARFRLGLKLGQTLNPDDNRALATNRIYHALESNPFLGTFYDANHKLLRLTKRRDDVGVVVALGDVPHMSGLPSPLEGAYKPVTESGIRDQDQDQIKARRLSPSPATDTADDNRKVIRALIRDVVDQHPDTSNFVDLKDLAKTRCAELRIAYDPEAVGSALEQVLARKARAS